MEKQTSSSIFSALWNGMGFLLSAATSEGLFSLLTLLQLMEERFRHIDKAKSITQTNQPWTCGNLQSVTSDCSSVPQSLMREVGKRKNQRNWNIIVLLPAWRCQEIYPYQQLNLDMATSCSGAFCWSHSYKQMKHSSFFWRSEAQFTWNRTHSWARSSPVKKGNQNITLSSDCCFSVESVYSTLYCH